MTTAREHLILDHFYISIASEWFPPLIELTQVFENCQHHHVQSEGDAWEGVYLSSKTGPYLEILNERRPEGLGIAFRSKTPQEVDVRSIAQELPNLPWKMGTRRKENGTPWFDWLSLGEYLDIQKTWFNAWIMHYHPNPSPKPKVPTTFSVNRFTSLHLSLGRNRVKELQELASWLPNIPVHHAHSLNFHIPDRDGNSFEVTIDLIDGDQKFVFKKLSMHLQEGVNLEDRTLGKIRLTQSGKTAFLEPVL